MSGKFMKTKRVVIPTLVLVALLSQASTAFAMTPGQAADLVSTSPTVTMELADVDAITMASPSIGDAYTFTSTGDKVVYAANTQTSFNDLKGFDWAAPAIRDMASKGIVKGIGDNKYAPADNVTREQFASMILRSFGSEKVSQLAQQASDKAKTDSNYTSLDKLNETYKGNWSNEVICAIQMFPSLDTTWGVSAQAWSANASREEMALIIMTIAEQLGNEKFEIKDNIQNNIGDWNLVSKLDNKDSILKAYSNGILVGTNDQGNYSPISNANRAEAAVVMQRVIDPSKRTEVVVKSAPIEEKPVTGDAQYDIKADGSNTSPTVGYQDVALPYEGAMFNGKPITRDSATGVLGFGNGQTGGIYLGIKIPEYNREIKVGGQLGFVYDNAVGNYTQRGQYVYWDKEWNKISAVAKAKIFEAGYKNGSTAPGVMADINGNITTDSSQAMFISDSDGFWDFSK